MCLEPMNNPPVDDDRMPAEIDFSKGARGLHHIPDGTRVFLPTDVLKRDIEINETRK